MSPIKITDANRDQFGGDIAITSTIPAIHPTLGIPLDQTRKSLVGSSLYQGTFWRGDIIYIPDPTLEFNFTRYCDDGHVQSRRLWMLLVYEKGFEECKASEWDLRPELRRAYQTVDNRICLPVGRNPMGKDEYEVVLVRPAARYFLELAKLQQMDNILPTAASRLNSSLDDTRGVSVLPPELTVTEHRYNPEDVRAKGQPS